jgi:hypothetical protein
VTTDGNRKRASPGTPDKTAVQAGPERESLESWQGRVLGKAVGSAPLTVFTCPLAAAGRLLSAGQAASFKDYLLKPVDSFATESRNCG